MLSTKCSISRIYPLQSARARCVDRCDQALVAVGADDHRLPLQLANLQDAFLADDLDTRIVAVIARQTPLIEPNPPFSKRMLTSTLS